MNIIVQLLSYVIQIIFDLDEVLLVLESIDHSHLL